MSWLAWRGSGEDFLIAATRLPAARLPLLAERLRRAVAGMPVDSPAGPLSVTVSTGHAHFARVGETAIGWERAVGRIDTALYAAHRPHRPLTRPAPARPR